MFLYIAIAIVNLCSEFSFFLYVLCLAGETLSHSKDDAADRSSNDYHFVHLTIAEVSAGAFWNQYALDCACDQSCAQSVVSDSSGRKRYQNPHSTPCFPTCCGSSSPLDLQDSWTFAQADGTLLYIFHTF